MAEIAPQSYASHKKLVPGFHFVMFGIFALNFLFAAFQVVRGPGPATVMRLLVAGALIALAFYSRMFALSVQDRVIRLEMRLKLEGLLPPDLRSRIPELTVAQLVGLRFASDAELAELTRKVLAEGIADRDSIKKLIRNWNPDHQRC